MEGGESPLDVLSRAATMVQANQAVVVSGTAEDCSKQNGSKQLPTAKWKRDRRSKLPEYSRKSDPKIPEVFEEQRAAADSEQCSGANSKDIPLDMSIRNRGQPPSYSQTVNNPGYRSSYRPSVIQNAVVARDEIPSGGISMCDPIIDEHFRRSLGNDYLALFNNNVGPKEARQPPQPPPAAAHQKKVVQVTDNAALSVDDHFAKALGDTWLKLNKKDGAMKNGDVVSI